MANISYGVNILPKANNTYTVGNSDYKWANIYTNQINGANISNFTLDKADIIKETITDTTEASFVNGANNYPVEELIVKIRPIQENQYNQTWPAGGGKNLFDPNSTSTQFVNTNYTIYNQSGAKSVKIPVSAGQKYYLSIKQTMSSGVLMLAYLDSSGNVLNRSGVSMKTYRSTGLTAPTDAVELIASISVWEGVEEVQLELNSTGPTFYVPYSNICPMSARTSITISQLGKNLLAAEDFDQDSEYYEINDDVITVKKEDTRSWDDVQVFYLAAGSYAITRTNLQGTLTIRTSQDNFTNDFLVLSSSTYIFQLSEGCGVKLKFTGSSATYPYDTKIILEEGFQPTGYEPFNLQQYTCSWETEAGAIYGGILDVTTGLLTVNKAKIRLDSLDFTATGTDPQEFVCDGNQITFYDKELACNTYQPTYVTYWSNMPNCSIAIHPTANNIFRIRDDRCADANELMTKLTEENAEIVYTITNPTTYQLTPIEIKTLLGSNYIIPHDGSVASIIYYADTARSIPDVTIQGISIMNRKVADLPIASTSNFGVTKIASGFGIYPDSSGALRISAADNAYIKSGTSNYRPIVPNYQHYAAFYGLAKAAGADMKNSSNTLGTYTDEAKTAIQGMLNVPSANAIGIVENGTTASQNIAQGQYVIWKGLLYKASSAISSGTTLSTSSNLTACSNGVANEIPKVSDSLSDTSVTNALSAAKGKALNDNITTITNNIGTVPSGNTVEGQISTLSNHIAKYAYVTELSDTVNANSNGSVVMPMPTGATQILALVPVSYIQSTDLNTHLFFSSVPDISTRTIYFRVFGQTAQKYRIGCLAIYI